MLTTTDSAGHITVILDDIGPLSTPVTIPAQSWVAQHLESVTDLSTRIRQPEALIPDSLALQPHIAKQVATLIRWADPELTQRIGQHLALTPLETADEVTTLASALYSPAGIVPNLLLDESTILFPDGDRIGFIAQKPIPLASYPGSIPFEPVPGTVFIHEQVAHTNYGFLDQGALCTTPTT